MPIDSLSPSAFDSDTGFTPVDLGKKEAETDPALPPLARQNFVDQASDIFATIRGAREQGLPLREAYKRANQAYLVDAEDPRLALQADIILSAPIACENSKRNMQLKDKREQSPLSSEEHQELHGRARVACEYNHRLRRLLIDNPDSFTRADVQSWIERGTGGDAMWAQKTVAGVLAEAAVMRVADKVPGVKVDPGTVEDDLKGTDFFLVRADGRRVPVDIKFGNQYYKDSDTYDRAIIHVDAEDIDDLSIAPHALHGMISQVTTAINN